MNYLKGLLYRVIMRIAHKYNWHYAPPIYPEGNTQLWCKWCGFRETIKYCDKIDGIKGVLRKREELEGLDSKN